jgi:hypothetical protein
MCNFELPKRPDTSLNLYKPDIDWEDNWRFSGYLYNDGKLNYSLDAYASGYLEAVEKLIKSVKNNEFGNDTFGYPIFYLFSHYLEIRMKKIILNGKELMNQNPEFPKSHNLVFLWEECKRVLKKIEEWEEYSDLDEETKKDYETIDHFIKEIAQDNSSQSFRYPVNRDGMPLLVNNSVQFLNIPVLSDVADWLSNKLDGISTGIYENLCARREFEAEYSGDEY